MNCFEKQQGLRYLLIRETFLKTDKINTTGLEKTMKAIMGLHLVYGPTMLGLPILKAAKAILGLHLVQAQNCIGPSNWKL